MRWCGVLALRVIEGQARMILPLRAALAEALDALEKLVHPVRSLAPRRRVLGRSVLDRLRDGRCDLLLGGQDQVLHAQPLQQRLHPWWQVAAVAQEAARIDRQARYQGEPFLLAQPRGGDSGGGGFRLALRQVLDQRRIAQPRAWFAQDFGLFARRDALGQGVQPLQRRCFQRIAFDGARSAQQVQQLPVLRARAALARSALAQHGGKAVVEQHRFLRHRASIPRVTRRGGMLSQ